MSKELEALESIKDFIDCERVNGFEDNLETIEEGLKALEIIKKYYDGFGVLFGEMSKEELGFLKEVLL